MPTLGLISDTHIPTRAKTLPRKVLERFKAEGVELILHAGDHVNMEVKKKLQRIAPVKAVKGNMDWDVEFPRYQSLTIAGKKLGLHHGDHVRPSGDISLLKEFAKPRNLDILVTGHTHTYFVKHAGDILFVNPGSPTNPQGRRKGSIAILDPAKGAVRRYDI